MPAYNSTIQQTHLKGSSMKSRLPFTFPVLCLSLSVVIGGCQYTRGNVVSASAKQNRLSTYHSLIRTAELNNVLAKDGPYTMFAPTNEAFNNLSSETLSNLKRPENREDLVAMLTYHIVPGEMMLDTLKKDQTLTTQNGAQIKINESSGQLMYGDGRIINPDIKATNGVIHVIDKVQMPPKFKFQVHK